MENLNLEIKYFGRIHYADIALNKINVVGGINSSGKSTASKLLYCYLKANATKTLQSLKEEAIPLMNIIIEAVNDPKNVKISDSSSDKYSIDDDFSDIVKEYRKAKRLFVKNKKLFELGFIYDDVINNADKLIHIINQTGKNFNVQLVKKILEDESLSKFKGISNFTGNFFKCSIINGEDYHDMEMHFNYNKYFDYPEFTHFKNFDGYYSSHGSFDFLTDVFYIDSFSIFDMKLQDSSYMEHIQHVINTLKEDKTAVKNEKIDLIQEKLNELIKGYFKDTSDGFLFFSEDYDDERDYMEYSLSPPKEVEFGKSSTDNTSSGIKQIGIIQLLLKNHKLVPGTFLIIDEPEVNLHPEWQFKFAEILVLLAMDLDIVIYLNSHSPMFIESIDAFCEYYDFDYGVNYYLTQESQTKGQYNFKKIERNKLYKIYESLGNGYKLINKLRLKKRLSR